MPDIDVTCLTNEFDPCELSASIAERGANAGPETWANSCAAAKASPLNLSDDDRRAVKAYFRGFGAWDDEEIDAWSDVETDAMVIQYAAGDLREAESLCPSDDDDAPFGIDWEDYEDESEAGRVSGSLYVYRDPECGREPRLMISLSE